MGVKTNMAAVAPIAGSITGGELLGYDVPGQLLLLQLKCQEMTKMLTELKNNVFTPASDSTAATAMTTAITALS